MPGVFLGYFSMKNINITLVKQTFPQIIPFPCDHRLGTKKSSKTVPKIIPKPFLESTNKDNKHNKHKQAQTSIIKQKQRRFPFILAQVTESRPQLDWSCIDRGLLYIFRCYALLRGGVRWAGYGPGFHPKMVPKLSKIHLKSVFAIFVNFARRAGHSSVLQGRRCENWSQNRPKVIPGFDFEVFGSFLSLKS